MTAAVAAALLVLALLDGAFAGFPLLGRTDRADQPPRIRRPGRPARRGPGQCSARPCDSPRHRRRPHQPPPSACLHAGRVSDARDLRPVCPARACSTGLLRRARLAPEIPRLGRHPRPIHPASTRSRNRRRRSWRGAGQERSRHSRRHTLGHRSTRRRATRRSALVRTQPINLTSSALDGEHANSSRTSCDGTEGPDPPRSSPAIRQLPWLGRSSRPPLALCRPDANCRPPSGVR